ncbi:GNAT family N-acetyltransferase [Pelagibius sp.]|uniref:GNAT family N-acetyltransferase n=1 Tax=Pelagibius sp. TaxID=1931238 RepID=UPI00262D92AB|nr:GNAT family N-acetyltransferase [Pelagibius sp.]
MTWCIERREIETERLRLRPFTAADAPAIQAYVSDWDIARMTTRIPHPYPEGAAADWIASHATSETKAGETIFCIARDGQPIGATSLRRRLPPAEESDVLEVGYWLARPHWGQGLATESTRALLAYAFTEPRVSAVTSGHFADNPASGRVLAKCGFRPTANDEEWSEARQGLVGCRRFILERAAWQAALDLAS